MLPLLINHICCAIDRLGKFNVPISNYGTKLEVTLPAQSGFDYFIVLSNPSDDLYINDMKISSNVIRINSGFILFKSARYFILNFIVFQLSAKCNSREFIINPREGNSYEYNDAKTKLYENSNYCLVVAGENEFDLTISKSSSNNNELVYSNFDFSKGFSILAGESKEISSTLGVCIFYTVTTLADTTLSLKINKDTHNSETPATITGHDANGYEAIAKDSIFVMDFSHSLNLGLNKLIIENTSVLYRIPKSSYIVFTEFKGITGKISILGGKTQEILGSTKIVSVYFNSSALISFQTDEKTPQPLRLVFFKNFPSNCTQIFTISGEGSIEDEAEGDESICVAAAFSSGTAKIKVEGNYNFYQADGVITPKELDDSVTLKFTSAVAVNFSSNTDEDAEFKLSVKTDDDDKSTKYIIKGSDNEYKSYFYAGKEFGELNGKRDHKKNNKAVMIVIISVATVVIIVIIVAIYICVKKFKKNHDVGVDVVHSDNYGEFQDNYAEPLVDE